VAVDAVGLAPGGGLTHLVNQAREFSRASEWEFTYFVAPRCYAQLADVVGAGRVRVPFSRPPGYLLRGAWEQFVLPRILAEQGFALLYCPANYAIFRSPVPQLLVDHNPWHHVRVSEIGFKPLAAYVLVHRWAARRSALRADATVYLTHSFAAEMAKVGFPPPTAIVYSGVSADWPALQGRSLVPDCPTCRTRGYALAVHNWSRHKRMEWLVDAWEGLGGIDGLHLVAAGSLPRGRRVELDKRAKESDGSQVTHVLGATARAALPDLYRHASVYVTASTLESFSLTPYEAMSFGVPCVLSDIPVHREVAKDAAVFFRPNDVGALTTAVQEARKRSQELSRRGLAGHLPSWRDNADQFLRLFQQLIGTSHG
jgi:glycosyltransferase involved in cell wall biosynthesis